MSQKGCIDPEPVPGGWGHALQAYLFGDPNKRIAVFLSVYTDSRCRYPHKRIAGISTDSKRIARKSAILLYGQQRYVSLTTSKGTVIIQNCCVSCSSVRGGVFLFFLPVPVPTGMGFHNVVPFNTLAELCQYYTNPLHGADFRCWRHV